MTPDDNLKLKLQASSTVKIDHIIEKIEAKTKNYDSAASKKDAYS